MVSVSWWLFIIIISTALSFEGRKKETDRGITEVIAFRLGSKQNLMVMDGETQKPLSCMLCVSWVLSIGLSFWPEMQAVVKETHHLQGWWWLLQINPFMPVTWVALITVTWVQYVLVCVGLCSFILRPAVSFSLLSSGPTGYPKYIIHTLIIESTA